MRNVHRFAGPWVLGAAALLHLACSGSIDESHEAGAPDTPPADAGPDATLTDDAGGGGGVDAEVLPDATADAAGDAADATVTPIRDAGPDAADASDASDAADAADAADASIPCPLDAAGEPTDLRCTGLYSDWASHTIAPDVQPFDPGLHLWSDGAVKTRWIRLPPGKKIDTSNMDEWVFPVDTRLWKEFIVGGKRLETRMLHKTSASGWYMTTYRWSDDGSTATELTAGAVNANDAGYEIPSQDKCTLCHQGRADAVLGFEAVSLSSPGASGLPMSTLVSRNLLTNPPAAPITIPGTPVEAQALGYLHANCGTTCHNSHRGLALQTGFFMRLETAKLGSVAETDTYTTGWNVATTGYHAVPTRIAACSPSQSCVFYRASHRDGVDAPTGTQMPPIDTHKVDDVGLAALQAWINESCDGGGGI